MHFKLFLLPITFLLLTAAFGIITVANSWKPEKGYVPDESTAIRVAEAILIPIYGEDDVISHRPYKAVLKNNSIWCIEGTLKKLEDSESSLIKGGVPKVELQKSDGRILNVIHGK